MSKKCWATRWFFALSRPIRSQTWSTRLRVRGRDNPSDWSCPALVDT